VLHHLQPVAPAPLGQCLLVPLSAVGRAAVQVGTHDPGPVLGKAGPGLGPEAGPAVQDAQLHAAVAELRRDVLLPGRGVHPRIAADQQDLHADPRQFSRSINESARNFVAQFGYCSGA